jgi:hypothetical protein
MNAPVLLSLHKYVPPLVVKVVLLPLHMVVVPVIVGVKLACTVTCTVALALQPVVTITV